MVMELPTYAAVELKLIPTSKSVPKVRSKNKSSHNPQLFRFTLTWDEAEARPTLWSLAPRRSTLQPRTTTIPSSPPCWPTSRPPSPLLMARTVDGPPWRRSNVDIETTVLAAFPFLVPRPISDRIESVIIISALPHNEQSNNQQGRMAKQSNNKQGRILWDLHPNISVGRSERRRRRTTRRRKQGRDASTDNDNDNDNDGGTGDSNDGLHRHRDQMAIPIGLVGGGSNDGAAGGGSAGGFGGGSDSGDMHRQRDQVAIPIAAAGSGSDDVAVGSFGGDNNGTHHRQRDQMAIPTAAAVGSKDDEDEDDSKNSEGSEDAGRKYLRRSGSSNAAAQEDRSKGVKTKYANNDSPDLGDGNNETEDASLAGEEHNIRFRRDRSGVVRRKGRRRRCR